MVTNATLERRVSALKRFIENGFTAGKDNELPSRAIAKRQGRILSTVFFPNPNRSALGGKPTKVELLFAYGNSKVIARSVYSNSEAKSDDGSIMPDKFNEFLKELVGEDVILGYVVSRKNGFPDTPVIHAIMPAVEPSFMEKGAYVKGEGSGCPGHVSFAQYSSGLEEKI